MTTAQERSESKVQPTPKPFSLLKNFKKVFRSFNTTEKALRVIIVISVIILGIAMGIMVFKSLIPDEWKVAITTFILLLPFSLFLQAWLNVEAVKDERQSKIEEGFRKYYARYIKTNKEKTFLSDDEIRNDEKFKLLIKDRTIFLIKDHQLYDLYREAYQIYKLFANKRISLSGSPDILEVKRWLLGFELDELLKIIITRKMKEEGTDFRSYLLPLSFFFFIYFAGFLTIISFLDAIWHPSEISRAFIPLFDSTKGIPIQVIQWGFLGGLVYTSIDLLSRFLRNDLIPRVYFNASFRLILSMVVAIIIYFAFAFVHDLFYNTDLLGNNATGQAGSALGNNATGQAGSALGNNATGQAGSALGNNATGQAGSALGNNATGQAGSALGNNATGQAGSALGNNATGQAGSALGNNATGQAGSALGNNATGQAGSALGNNATGQAGSALGNNATGQAGSALGNNATGQTSNSVANSPPMILLLCFLAGVAPVQFLIHFADSQLSKINPQWKRRDTAGNRPIIQLEGINSVTASRLSEEGIDYINQMAYCYHDLIATKTNFPLDTVKNWKDQAILYSLIGDVTINEKNTTTKTGNDSKKSNDEYLIDVLNKRLGVQNISSLIDLWKDISKKDKDKDEEIKLFFLGLGLLNDAKSTDDKNFYRWYYLFENVVRQGKLMRDNNIIEEE